MSTKVMTLKVPEIIYHKIEQYELISGKNQSEIIRESLDEFLNKKLKSVEANSFAYLATKWKGSLKGKTDLSTNKKYMDEFGI